MWYILKELFTSVSVKVVDIYLHFGNTARREDVLLLPVSLSFSTRRGRVVGNMADTRGRTFHIGDLFPDIKRLFCEVLRTFDCLDQRKVDSCSLKFNKKLVNGDLIFPAFVRTCLGDVMNDDKVDR